MKKVLVFILGTAIAVQSYAGGLVTNTNQSASFLRNMARGTSLSPDAIYYNPAGTAFLEKGWHFSINDQQAIQRRWTNSTFAPFAHGANNSGKETKHFQGNTFSPVVPSVYAAYKRDRLALSFAASIGSGGGSVEYNNGLASFESVIAQIPAILPELDPMVHYVPYKADIYLKGTSITVTTRIGAAYRISDNFSAAAQLRIAYTSNKYEGHIKDIVIAENQTPFKDLIEDKELDTRQTGWGFSPILSAYFKSNGARDGESFNLNSDKKQGFGHGWSASVKYEFCTSVQIKNKTKKDVVLNGASLYPDGERSESDLPSILTACVSKHLGPVKLSAQFLHYFDQFADNFFTDGLNGNTDEFIFGVDWKLSRRILLSTAFQRSLFELDPQKYRDLNFNSPSTSVGLGISAGLTRHLSINTGCMLTKYSSVTRESDPYNSSTAPGIPGKDVYHRQSVCYGIGLDLHF